MCIFQFLILFSMSYPFLTSACNETYVYKCDNKIIPFRDFTIIFNKRKFELESRMDFICWRLDSAFSCVETLQDQQCSAIYNVSLSSINSQLKLYNMFCDVKSEFHKSYIKYSDCIARVADEIDKCKEQWSEQVSDIQVQHSMIQSEDYERMQSYLCDSKKLFFSCIDKVMGETCGKSFMINQVFQVLTQPFTEKYHCSGKELNDASIYMMVLGYFILQLMSYTNSGEIGVIK